MYRTLMIAVLLFTSAAFLQAQQTSSDQTSGKTSGATTIEGCLQSSGGSYTLTEADGTKVTLSSHANQMIKHVGHQVQITGKPAVKTIGTTEQGGPSTAHQVPVFRVQSIKHVADTCTAK